MNHLPIPHKEFPGKPTGLQPVAEPLVDIAAFHEPRLRISMEYHRQGLPGATSRCLLRQSAADRLLQALVLLPPGFGFQIYDAWRPIQVQQALFDSYYQAVKNSPVGQSLSEEQLLDQVRRFVSIPSYDPMNPSVHNTGGAVDLTILDDQGYPLPMGTAFDDFTQAAHIDHFETHEGPAYRDNRRLLYACMTAVGFTNLPSEWWHYDYGTNFWSYYTGQPAIYTGILSEG